MYVAGHPLRPTVVHVVMTAEQAGFIGEVLRQHRKAIETRWSLGIWEGLLVAVAEIQDAGGVLRPKEELLGDADICAPVVS